MNCLINTSIMQESQVSVWSISLKQPAPIVEKLKSFLPHEERKQRECWVVAHGALQTILRHTLKTTQPLEFSKNKNGKPFLKESALEFNLSHSHDMALVAVSKKIPVGIDIEKIKPNKNIQNIATRFFSAREADQIGALSSSEQLTAFYTCWTRKEALIKAKGTRFSSKTQNSDEICGWSIHSLPVETGYMAALAIKDMEGESNENLTQRISQKVWSADKFLLRV